MSQELIYKELIETIIKEHPSKIRLNRLKHSICRKYKVKKHPTDIQILLHATSTQANKLKLITKPTRTISGVAVVAVMSYPFSCPHGKCLMCPGGPDSVYGNVPQSYTGKEPATMRALRNEFDPYRQVMNRLEHYIVMGQSPEKVELIIMGGTFPSFNKKYQENFVKYCFKAMNDFSSLFYKKGKFNFKKFKDFFELPGAVDDPLRAKHIKAKLVKLKKIKLRRTEGVGEAMLLRKGRANSSSLQAEQKKNQSSNIKCVGLTLETRPDFAKLKQANEMLKLGCTRVELGVQSVYDKALKKIKRGHSVQDTIESIKILKDLGFKINAHYMLGLPGISKKEDLDGLKELFNNPDFKPDMLKLYPCMVVEGTKLYNLWKKKKFKPMTTKQAANLIAKAKKFIPKYVRIMRVQRDIPTYMTAAGVDRTNLRQYVEQITKKQKIKCKCIRCREIGRAKTIAKPKIKVMYYNASNGNEFFISAEDKYNNLFGFCRLRFPNQSLRKEITEDSALIRELHVYGPATAIGKKGKIQHKGIGKKLLKQAEDIAKMYHKEKIIIISGIGVRDYYKKLKYRLEGPYMVKRLI
ncbi:tRNA uridine(34) 5-carboxymethylaminomethyl modification radical SAM/GNAT enzyme Elp3 [Candidatus Woesearchaeota archaeon]|nr:tRNA uridine(34) 5-carboxymethylaminomethyl modification radical SAM/GNAT enzyme Elp3 [Candidatus Woesearchaeota archaeon]